MELAYNYLWPKKMCRIIHLAHLVSNFEKQRIYLWWIGEKRVWLNKLSITNFVLISKSPTGEFTDIRMQKDLEVVM